ncbi:hypothetical protein BGY98DRAFT_959254, partial [Russula aff. rugulosa BPL654]
MTVTDCAKYLNGRGVGARYDGSIRTGIGSTFSQEYKDLLTHTYRFYFTDYHDTGCGVDQSKWLDVDVESRTGGR